MILHATKGFASKIVLCFAPLTGGQRWKTKHNLRCKKKQGAQHKEDVKKKIKVLLPSQPLVAQVIKTYDATKQVKQKMLVHYRHKKCTT